MGHHVFLCRPSRQLCGNEGSRPLQIPDPRSGRKTAAGMGESLQQKTMLRAGNTCRTSKDKRRMGLPHHQPRGDGRHQGTVRDATGSAGGRTALHRTSVYGGAGRDPRPARSRKKPHPLHHLRKEDLRGRQRVYRQEDRRAELRQQPPCRRRTLHGGRPGGIPVPLLYTLPLPAGNVPPVLPKAY